MGGHRAILEGSQRITAVVEGDGVEPPNVPEFFQSIRLLAIPSECRSFPAVIHTCESVFLAVTLAVLTGGSTSFCVYQPSGRQDKQAGLSPASRPSAIVLVKQKPAIGPGAWSGGKLKELSRYLSLAPESNRDLQCGPLATDAARRSCRYTIWAVRVIPSDRTFQRAGG